MIERYLKSPDDNIIMVGVKHPKYRTITEEVKSISKDFKKRPLITNNITIVHEQARHYEQVATQFGHREYHMIDSAILFHNLKFEEAKRFRCLWQSEIQFWSDRDQISFPFVLAELSQGLEVRKFANYTLIPLRFDDKICYFKILTDPKFSWHVHGLLVSLNRGSWGP
jgi:hypothetical protein